MSSLFLLIYGLEVLSNVSLFLVILIGIPLGVLLGYLLTHWIENSESYNQEDKEEAYNFRLMLAKKTKVVTFTIIWIVIVLFYIILPTKTQLITYISLIQIDKYNIESVDSKLNPKEMLKTIDNTIKKVDELLNGNKKNKKS